METTTSLRVNPGWKFKLRMYHLSCLKKIIYQCHYLSDFKTFKNSEHLTNRTTKIVISIYQLRSKKIINSKLQNKENDQNTVYKFVTCQKRLQNTDLMYM